MRYGLITPVVSQLPGAHAAWEERAGIAEVAEIAAAADRLGFDHMTCSEHVAVPPSAAAVRGSMYWDPLATFGFVAAHTTRIRLATYVLVLGYHHPLDIAKRYGTLDVVSAGRLVLGVGVGNLREEFELLGAPFDDRGRRADDAITALRRALSQRCPAYDGQYFSFRDMIVEPCAVQARVPVWVGGRSRAALRRAIALGDAWVPFGLARTEVQELLAAVELPPGFDVVLRPTDPIDPAGDPARAADAVHAWEQAGATILTPNLVHHSVAHFIEQLHALRELAA